VIDRADGTDLHLGRLINDFTVGLSDCAADNGVSGRNCDRAVKGSPALEAFDERGGLFQIHAAEDEV
jgi:hypothetical protein